MIYLGFISLFDACFGRSKASEHEIGRVIHWLGTVNRHLYAGLYQRVDKLLREIANRNLHDIRNMSFRVELWDQHPLHIRWVFAAAGSVFLARAAFDEAVRQWRDQKLTLSCASIQTRRANDNSRSNFYG